MEKLLNELDEAYARNDKESIAKVNEKIQRFVLGDTVSTEDVISGLMENIKGKTVYKNIKKVCEGKEVGKKGIAKILSSMVTHMIIESDVKDKDLKLFPIREIQNKIDSIIYDEGDNIDDIREYIKEKFNRFI